MEKLTLNLRNPIPSDLAERFQKLVKKEIKHLLFREEQTQKDGASIQYSRSQTGEIVALNIPYDGSVLKKRLIQQKVSDVIGVLEGDQREELFGGMGVYPVRLKNYYLPILVCIGVAMVLAYLQWELAQIQIDGAPWDEAEGGAGAVILNAFFLVGVAAIGITVIYLLVKKFGTGLLRYIFGTIVILYNWIIGIWFIQIIMYLLQVYRIVFDIVYYASMVAMFIILIQYYRRKTSSRFQSNSVLVFGMLLGALIGTMLPTWSMIAFVLLLSLWDIIAVFKGPLGKIMDLSRAEMEEGMKIPVEEEEEAEVHEQQDGEQDIMPQQIEEKEEEQKSSEAIDQNLSDREETITAHKIQKRENKEAEEDEQYRNEIQQDWEKTKEVFRNDVVIGIGSGDLILYSALVAHVFIRQGSILATIFTMIGIMLGAKMTFDRLLDILIKHEMGEEVGRQLPGLPLSMAFGVIGLFLGVGLELLLF